MSNLKMTCKRTGKVMYSTYDDVVSNQPEYIPSNPGEYVPTQATTLRVKHEPTATMQRWLKRHNKCSK